MSPELLLAGVGGLALLCAFTRSLLRETEPRGESADALRRRGRARLGEAELYARAHVESELAIDRERARRLLADAMALLAAARERGGYRGADPRVDRALRAARQLQEALGESPALAPASGSLSSSDGSLESSSPGSSGV